MKKNKIIFFTLLLSIVGVISNVEATSVSFLRKSSGYQLIQSSSSSANVKGIKGGCILWSPEIQKYKKGDQVKILLPYGEYNGNTITKKVISNGRQIANLHLAHGCNYELVTFIVNADSNEVAQLIENLKNSNFGATNPDSGMGAVGSEGDIVTPLVSTISKDSVASKALTASANNAPMMFSNSNSSSLITVSSKKILPSKTIMAHTKSQRIILRPLSECSSKTCYSRLASVSALSKKRLGIGDIFSVHSVHSKIVVNNIHHQLTRHISSRSNGLNSNREKKPLNSSIIKSFPSQNKESSVIDEKVNRLNNLSHLKESTLSNTTVNSVANVKAYSVATSKSFSKEKSAVFELKKCKSVNRKSSTSDKETSRVLHSKKNSSIIRTRDSIKVYSKSFSKKKFMILKPQESSSRIASSSSIFKVPKFTNHYFKKQKLIAEPDKTKENKTLSICHKRDRLNLQAPQQTSCSINVEQIKSQRFSLKIRNIIVPYRNESSHLISNNFQKKKKLPIRGILPATRMDPYTWAYSLVGLTIMVISGKALFSKKRK